MKLFDEVLELSLKLKDSDPKLARKALETLAKDRSRIRHVWVWGSLELIEKEKIQLAEDTLEEIREKSDVRLV